MDIVQATDNWIENKVAVHCAALIKILKTCVLKVGPKLEKANFGILVSNKTKFGEIDAKELDAYLKQDLKSAQEGYQIYRLTENLIRNRLVLISSNFGFQKFAYAAMKDLEGTDFAELNQMVRGFEKVILDPIKDHFELMIDFLIQLEGILEKQLALLVDLTEGTSGSLGHMIEERNELQKLFFEEMQLFNKFSKNIHFPNPLLKKYNKRYKYFVTVLRNRVTGIQKHIEEEWENEMRDKEKLQKALVLMRYVVSIGFFLYKFQTDFPETLAKQGRHYLKFIHQKRNEKNVVKLRVTSKQLDDAAREGQIDAIVAFAKNIAA